MRVDRFEVVAAAGSVSDTSDSPKGANLFSRCRTRDGVIASQPGDNVGRPCGTVFIDIDYFRLAGRDYATFEVIRPVTAWRQEAPLPTDPPT